MQKYVSPRVDVNELILIEEQETEVKCGKCNKPMHFQIYYKEKETFDFLVCKECNIFLQRIIVEDEK
ncbi:MAG: hypothetical protein K9W45_04735 [Candidatus Heimdallarchaeum aukensis]|uniref:Uncharacterized protein n=1 Tax=Candidatus Heimdallarchaeum aukensis TaxID=2876573 RepID=A0A9Y1FMM6_9ARCH|nr:MAG: hypothetical protein K9W45_04735 [Candidatus Heimdallarchaeum aukensis]